MKIKKDDNKEIVHFTEYLRVLLAAIGSTRVTELKSSDAGGHTLHTSRQRVGGQRTWALHVGWRLSIVRGSCGHARSLTKTHYRLNAVYQFCFQFLDFFWGNLWFIIEKLLSEHCKASYGKGKSTLAQQRWREVAIPGPVPSVVHQTVSSNKEWVVRAAAAPCPHPKSVQSQHEGGRVWGRIGTQQHAAGTTPAVANDLHTQIMQPPCLSFTDILLEKQV